MMPIKCIAVLLVLITAALAEGNIPPTFFIQPNPSLTIGTGKTYVVIRPDGTIEYGAGYDPDEAAKAFWAAIGRNMPKDCK